MYANCQLFGMDIGLVDVCRTPIPPVPWPNIALGPMTIPVCFNILLIGTPQHNLMSIRPLTLGDILGVGLGVISQTVMAAQRHVTGAFTHVIRGTAATKLGSMGPANLFNAVSARCVPSHTKVALFCP